MESRPLRVGFLSTAQIGRKVSWAAKEAGVALSAVASRDLAKAEAFAAAWGFAKAYGSYDELLADPDIDAVYIPLPTALHCEWVLKAAAAGKSVLLDKPCATSLGELARMTRACAAAGVQYMDNTMFMHGDRMAAMEAYLRGPGAPLGVLRSAQAAFTFNADAAFLAKDIRLQPALEPAGAIGDLGHYCVRFAMFAFGWDRPPATVAALLQARAGTPSAATATLMWEPIDGDDGVAPVATLTCGFHSAFRQTAEVAGTRGTLWLDDFVLARSGEAAFTVVIDPHMDDLDRSVHSTPTRVAVAAPHGHAETRLWTRFAALVAGVAQSGGRSRDKFWPLVSLRTQAVQDAILESIACGGARVTVAHVDAGDA